MLMAYFLLLMGLAITIMIEYRKYHYNKCTEETIGKITKQRSMIFYADIGYSQYNVPQIISVEYELDGKIIKAQSICGIADKFKYHVGSNIKIFYNPDKPNICVDEYAKEEKRGMRKRDTVFAMLFFLLGLTIILTVYIL